MAAVTRSRLASGSALVGVALALPFPDGAFERIFTGYFYGHLPPDEREPFLAEGRRVARELVVVDCAPAPGVPTEEWQQRVLNDGSRHRVFKQYLAPDRLARELDGEVLVAGIWFVAAGAVFQS